MALKDFKPVHWLYNILHYKSLRHNRGAYDNYKVKKSLIASISSRDFADRESKAWLDIGNSRELAPTKKSFQFFEPAVQSEILGWSDKGYMLLKGFVNETTCDDINAEIDRLIKNKNIRFINNNKLMFVFKKSNLIRSVSERKELLDIMNFILGREVVLFQTINFITGSEQRPHSDSIHMTTYPLGFLIAGWLALENTTKDNGPLCYYPGSHKLPYFLNADFNEAKTPLHLGKKKYPDYENEIDRLIQQYQLPKVELYAKKGDLFIWHANLLHGGAPIIDRKLTRKSMVMHYFAKDVIKYHDITERPSLLDDA
jgi:ectoine hydroxylase-related dioxygenase (phytanoyl-CoA dioxygenase family)